jgi:hypothetical protein
MVVGIFPDHDCLMKLVDAMKASGYHADRLRVISPETPSDEFIGTGVQFTYSGDSEAESIGIGSSIITSFGGTAVPGLTELGPRLSNIRSTNTTEDLLEELNIPASRFEGYCEAVDAGRCIAGFNAGAEIDKVRSLFSGAGGNPVEVF